MTTHEQPRERDELARLVSAAREGDRPAFDELVRRTYVDTYTLALRLTAHEEDARDVVQESYLRAWKGLPRFRGDAQFTTWMYRITANTAYTVVKRRRRHRAESLDAMLEDPIELRPERAARGRRRSRPRSLERLAVGLDELPPKLRVLVVLKDIYGLSHEEIAEELGISVPAAKVRLHRGRKRLRDLLYDDDSKNDGRWDTCNVTTSPNCFRPTVEHGAAVEVSVQRHIESCLRCQAELARYRRMLRGLQLLRTRYLEPSPGLLAQTFAAHRGSGRAPGGPLDPLGSSSRLRRCHRWCGRRRHRSHGDGTAGAPVAATRGTRRQLTFLRPARTGGDTGLVRNGALLRAGRGRGGRGCAR